MGVVEYNSLRYSLVQSDFRSSHFPKNLTVMSKLGQTHQIYTPRIFSR